MRFQSFAQMPLAEIDLIYDIATCHAFCCPLRLRELRDAGIEEFVSDVLGIKRHLEIKRRVLGGGFLPRYSASTETAA